MTLRRLENLPPHRLSESEMTWLKNRAHDHRPEVKSLACAVFAERFPCTARKPGFFDRLKTTLWLHHRVCASLHSVSPAVLPSGDRNSTAPSTSPSHRMGAATAAR